MGNSYTIEMAERLSALLARSRAHGGLSRREISKAVNVSESTVKMWEMGQGSPGLSGVLRWLYATGQTAFGSFPEIFWPEHFGTPILKKDDRERIATLSAYLRHMARPLEVRKLHYLLFGEHREQLGGILQLFCAYVQIERQEQCEIDRIMHSAYEVADAGRTTVFIPEVKASPWILQQSSQADDIYAGGNANMESFLMGVNISGVSSAMMRQSRADAGVTHRFLSKAMGKTERTIHNWEHKSEPSFLDLCNWFHTLERSLWGYFCAQMNADELVRFTERDEILREEIIDFLPEMDGDSARRLAYLILGDHSAYWYVVLEMLFEYVSLPLAERILLARAVLMAYRFCGRVCTESEKAVAPDLSVAERCIDEMTQLATRG